MVALPVLNKNEECSECASNFYLEATSVAGVTDPVNRCHGEIEIHQTCLSIFRESFHGIHN